MKDDIYNPNARFHESNEIHETAIIYDNVSMGKNNKIGAYSVIGSDGEIRGAKAFKGRVVIGDNNIVSELVTIQRPANESETVIGNDNIVMAHSHIGHDAKIGDNCEISSGSIIGGYAIIKNGAKIKLGCIVRNRKEIGEDSIVGMGAVVVKNVEPKTIVVGNPAKPLK